MIKRAISVKQILSKKFNTMKFTGAYKDSFGEPEMGKGWIVWGNSGNGKTTLLMKLCKYLTNFGTVAYNSLEEGDSASMQKVIAETQMIEVQKKFKLLDAEPLDELKDRLRRQKSPDIIVIDSIQYVNMTYKDWISLKTEFRNKLFILVSHADGKKPDGRAAKRIQFDCDLKIRVEGFKAFTTGRAGGGADFIIWEQGAAEYWGIQN